MRSRSRSTSPRCARTERASFRTADDSFYRRGISGLVLFNPLEGQAGVSSRTRIGLMARRALVLVAGAAAAAAAVFAVLGRVRRRGGPESNGGRERTEELRREIEAARARLRESIRSKDG